MIRVLRWLIRAGIFLLLAKNNISVLVIVYLDIGKDTHAELQQSILKMACGGARIIYHSGISNG